jgi:hypothetical protein
MCFGVGPLGLKTSNRIKTYTIGVSVQQDFYLADVARKTSEVDDFVMGRMRRDEIV